MTKKLFATVASCALAAAAATATGEDEGPAAKDAVYVELETNLGPIVLELDKAKAPITVENFEQYVNDGFYDGTIFHRVIGTFMIQGGGFDVDMNKKETRSGIKNEWQNGLKNTRGTISMARLGNQPDSATAQFFINVVDNPALDTPRDGAGYAVFGHVIGGMDVVDAIKGVPTGIKMSGPNQMRDVPQTTIKIEKARVVPGSEAKDVAAAADKAGEGAGDKLGEIKDQAQAEAKQKLKADFDEGIAFVAGQGVDVSKGTKTDSGLWYVDEVVGDGASPANSSSQVICHYTLWLPDGKQIQSSHQRGKPIPFALNRVIRAWTEGVGSMKVGGVRYLVAGPDIAYGPNGNPPMIPRNATLVFKVELVDVPS